MPRQILLNGTCTMKGCRLPTTSAKKVSDFWVEYCDTHAGVTIELSKDNINKIGKYVPSKG